MATVRPATDRDSHRIVSTSLVAFAEDPHLRFIVPDDAGWWGGRGAAVFELADTWFGAIGERWVTDDVVAVCLWSPPESLPAEPAVLARMEAVRSRLTAADLDRSHRLEVAFRSHHPPQPHVYVGLLATHPDWQRQGLGRQVLAPALEHADRHRVGTLLDTGTPQNVAFYRGLGFEVWAEHRVPDGPVAWAMWRSPVSR